MVLVYYVPIADNDALDGLHPGCLMPSVIHTEARKIARYTKSILSGREKERERVGEEETNGEGCTRQEEGSGRREEEEEEEHVKCMEEGREGR